MAADVAHQTLFVRKSLITVGAFVSALIDCYMIANVSIKACTVFFRYSTKLAGVTRLITISVIRSRVRIQCYTVPHSVVTIRALDGSCMHLFMVKQLQQGG